MQVLKRFIRKLIFEDVGSEEQVQKLRKWAETNADENEQLLLKHDIIPIKRSDDDSYLGSGAFSFVYEAIWNGKHVAAKITKSKDDVVAMEKMDELRDVYGSEHITKVYDIIVHEDERVKKSRFKVKGRSSETYIIIAEYLVNPPRSLEAEYFFDSSGPDFDNPYEKEKAGALVSYDEVASIVNNVIPNADDELIHFVDDTFSEFKSFRAVPRAEITKFKEALNGKGVGYSEILNILKSLINKRNKNMSSKEIPSSAKGYKSGKTTNALKQKREEEGFKFEDPRVESFMNFLIQLDEDDIAEWGDIRVENVMMRSSTGDLVVSDPGLFKFK